MNGHIPLGILDTLHDTFIAFYDVLSRFSCVDEVLKSQRRMVSITQQRRVITKVKRAHLFFRKLNNNRIFRARIGAYRVVWNHNYREEVCLSLRATGNRLLESVALCPQRDFQWKRYFRQSSLAVPAVVLLLQPQQLPPLSSYASPGEDFSRR